MRTPEGVDLDFSAVGKGALLGLLVVAPVGLADLVLSAVDGLDKGAVVFPLFVVILGGFFLAGHRAASRATGSPYTHGAAAGLAAFALWLPLRITARALAGGQLIGQEGDAALDVVEVLATTALLSMSLGILGGLVASRRSRRA